MKNKNFVFLIYLLLLFFLFSCCKREDSIEQAEREVCYEFTDSIFPNPERGLWHLIFLCPEQKELIDPLGNVVDISSLKKWRDDNYSLVLTNIYLKEFRERPLPEEALINFHNQLALLREGGFKCIMRFIYANSDDEPDASLEMILTHCEQFRPWLSKNSDVIAVLQAGFIGAWGEWHSSSHGLTNPEDENIILKKLLEILPENRMIQVRTPAYKMNFLEDSIPLNFTEAYSKSARARIGHHNDCFLSNNTDRGTYRNDYDREYVQMESMYVSVGGETCPPVEMELADCIKAQLEMRKYGWSFLNGDYYMELIEYWIQRGCWEDIVCNLGYRLGLVNGCYSENVAPGGEMKISFTIYNSGYASVYNSRLVELILLNKNNRYKLTVDTDPRWWKPLEKHTIELTAGIPEDIPEGNYRFYLNLPDPDYRLYDNPAYSIRLANKGVWEVANGYNDLQVEIEVNSNVKSHPYTGDLFFK